ncbi:class I SAM-dependent methyltransferase [Weeksella sp. HMSC059D05]|uniref:class I SAM-dependent methyltransferase n=1 Tax=Weeksella sp. HMSC059D05 TaxID=1715139 RepID=UPI0008A39A9A|nr:class I SAM-dependent methyltransferase [Weeksella sp. HMSC059D05]OFM82183.1 polyketide synthase [Weeksella sp. HMSC059D05]
MDKRELRETIFRHLDGIVVAPIISALAKRGVLHFLLTRKKVSLKQVAEEFQANEGYLNVAFHVLASQNYLLHEVDNSTDEVTISLSKYSERAFRNYEIYQDLAAYLSNEVVYNSIETNQEFCTLWMQLYTKYQKYIVPTHQDTLENKKLHHQICKHIEGALIAPLAVRLGMSGMFHKYFMEASFSADEYHKNPQHFEKILSALAQLGWFDKKGKNFQFTPVGLFFARRATAYGVTVSYLPLFAQLNELLFGVAKKIREIEEGQDEKHVHREMNVWGSGGAHATYFKIIDEFIIDIFNRPLNLQPKGILDMGSGNGALLQHLYEVIERKTLRGKYLDEYPLFLVGADYNEAALRVTRANLIQNDIWAKVIWGDISDPKTLAHDLQHDYGIHLSDLLNMRSFLDHNRIWTDVDKPSNRISTSTGAFAYRGKRISNNAIEDNLQEHLENWKPFLQKYGLLLIELHGLSPKIAAENLGKTPATAYDATHGFSDQYIVEYDIFKKICDQVGLESDPKLMKLFPIKELVTVSIQHLTVKETEVSQS